MSVCFALIHLVMYSNSPGRAKKPLTLTHTTTKGKRHTQFSLAADWNRVNARYHRQTKKRARTRAQQFFAVSPSVCISSRLGVCCVEVGKRFNICRFFFCSLVWWIFFGCYWRWALKAFVSSAAAYIELWTQNRKSARPVRADTRHFSLFAFAACFGEMCK